MRMSWLNFQSNGWLQRVFLTANSPRNLMWYGRHYQSYLTSIFYNHKAISYSGLMEWHVGRFSLLARILTQECTQRLCQGNSIMVWDFTGQTTLHVVTKCTLITAASLKSIMHENLSSSAIYISVLAMTFYICNNWNAGNGPWGNAICLVLYYIQVYNDENLLGTWP